MQFFYEKLFLTKQAQFFYNEGLFSFCLSGYWPGCRWPERRWPERHTSVMVRVRAIKLIF